MGARVNQRGVGRDQAAQPLDIAGIDRGDGVVKPRVRFEPGDPVGRLDEVLEPRPVVEAILPREHPLRIGNRQRPVEDRLRRLSFHPGMMRDNAGRGRRFSLAMITTQLTGLNLELGEVGTGRQSAAWHMVAPFARAGCPRPVRKKRGRIVRRLVGGTQSLSADGKRPTTLATETSHRVSRSQQCENRRRLNRLCVQVARRRLEPQSPFRNLCRKLIVASRSQLRSWTLSVATRHYGCQYSQSWRQHPANWQSVS
jgi:hypothetical protein